MRVIYIVKWLVLLLLNFLVFSSNNLYSQCKTELEFDRISVEQGLSQGTVNCILQDHKGFLWFATSGGLNRFDGISFKTYLHNPNSKSSISDNDVSFLFEDSKKRLWIGTNEAGLNQFNWKDESFLRFSHNPLDPNSLSSNRIRSIVDDKNGDIWIATLGGGVNIYNPQSGKFRVYSNTFSHPNVLPSNSILDIKADLAGNIILATSKGLCKFDYGSQTFIPINIVLPGGQLLANILINCIEIDSKGCIWIGTTNSGLFRYSPVGNQVVAYDEKFISKEINEIYQSRDGNIWIVTISGLFRYNSDTDVFDIYKHNPNNQSSLSSDFIRTVYEDNQNNLWVGTYGFGLNKHSWYQNSFSADKNFLCNYPKAPSLTVRSFFEDDDYLWLGTYGEGVIKVNSKTLEISQIKHNQSISNSLADNFVYSICKNQQGDMWFATFEGLSQLNPKTSKVTTLQHDPNNPKSLPTNRIRGVFVDSRNTLWYSAFIDYFGRLLPDNRSFETFIPPSLDSTFSLTTTSVTSIFEDKQGTFWIATLNRGLFVFDRDKGEFVKHYHNIIGNPNTISSDRINCLFEDRKGRLWAGTENGINLFDRKAQTFRSYNKSSGLPNDAICGILEDDYGIFWISTRNGLSRADFRNLDSPKFRSYDRYDGLKNSEFFEGAFLKAKSGMLFFSGVNNFNAFHPNNIVFRTTPPPVVITEVEVSPNSHSKKDSTFSVYIGADSISLNHSQNSITFYFAALNYLHSQKNKYRFMLEGFDNNWIEPIVSNQRFVKYNNLRPGKYTFKVIAAIPDGVWNEEGDTFHFYIRPPFVNTIWFYLIVSLIFSGFIFGLIKLRESRLIKTKKELEQLVEERTREFVNQSEELLLQSEYLQQANEEIRATSEALTEQNEILKYQNEEITKKRNELEDQKNSLANLAWELQDKNEEITEQSNEIERQKKEITDSIMYAQRIQNAVLPTQEQIKELFTEFFVINRPKSIVSGDFYWASRVGKHRVIAVADCTGHGVPGGFMSMLGVLMLNEVISLRGILDPSKALNKLRQGIISVLHQKGEFTDASDGMDISLCIIDDEANTLTYSGANTSIILFEPTKKEDNGITVLRSDRMPIAYHPLMKSFSNYVHPITKDTIIYIYSDGLIDQFGGPEGKKFQQTRLLDIILKTSNLPVETQGIVIEQAFDNWKDKMYQVDDVLFLGLKV